VAYRDELDAALARAAALERELREAREGGEPPAPEPRLPMKWRALAAATAVLFIGLFVWGVWPAHEPYCTLATEPPGATLHAVYGDNTQASGVDHSLGITPVAASLEEWRVNLFMNRRFYLTLPGYGDADVAPPIAAMNAHECADQKVKLQPAR
jgi:hypothetical protein